MEIPVEAIDARPSCLRRTGDAVPQALTSGFQVAFWGGAGIAAVGVVASLVLSARRSSRPPPRSSRRQAEVLAEAA